MGVTIASKGKSITCFFSNEPDLARTASDFIGLIFFFTYLECCPDRSHQALSHKLEPFQYVIWGVARCSSCPETRMGYAWGEKFAFYMVNTIT